ncbi:MAG: sensor histidine kinase [Candidatus Nanopelagicales bacterium]
MRFVLGPWPFFPVVVSSITFLFFFLTNLQVSVFGNFDSCRNVCVDLPEHAAPAIVGQYGDAGLSPFDPVLVVGNALIASVAIGVVLWLFSRVLRADPEGSPSRGAYLLAVITASAVGGLVRLFVLSPILVASPSMAASGFLPNTVRTFVTITVVQSVAGLLTRRYVRQAAMATAALEIVVQQQRLVVEADERARRNVAEFLHDRVQADLLVVAMELRAATEGVDPAVSERLERSIAELERIRSTEVRSASRRLSPAFGSVGLDTALDDLADSWSPALTVRISFDSPARDLLVQGTVPRDLLVAVYRVTEQAILNAAAHGRASRTSVSLTMPTPSTLALVVSDDGRGLPPGDIARGAGSAIMDAWCAVAQGEWRWIPSARGVTLQATFSV